MAEFSEVKDSGERQEFGTGSVRDTRDGKGRYDLLPPKAMKRVAKHFENGAKKYGDRNWEKGQPLSRYLDSALRHVFNILDGDVSEDHPAAAAWNMLAFIHTQEMVEAGNLPADLNDLAEAGPTRITYDEYVVTYGSKSKDFNLLSPDTEYPWPVGLEVVYEDGTVWKFVGPKRYDWKVMARA